MSRNLNEQMNALIPMVVEQTSKGERAYDIFSRLFNTIVPVQKMTIALKDALFKVSGILTSFVYIVMILFNMLKKFFGIILIATIVSLFIITLCRGVIFK